MNKKAQTSVFETSLVIILLIACVYSLVSFYGMKDRVEISLTAPTKLINLYIDKAALEFYLEESVKLAARDAFYETAMNGAVEDAGCKDYNGYFIWGNGCRPSSSQFESVFSKSLEKYTDRKFESTLENGNLSVNFEDSMMNASEKSSFMSYYINYTFDPIFVIDMKNEGIDLDFEKVYSSVLQKQGECRLTKNPVTCMKMFKTEGWETSGSGDGEYMLFDLKSEKLFFIDDKLQQITLKFALQI